jgi:O-antigen/teichoic acid export membrane protein
LATLLSTPAGWFSRTVLVNQPGGYPENALVSAANQWLNLVNFLPYTMGGVLVPIFANLYASGRRDEFMKLLRHNLFLNACVALAVALPLILLASVIMGFYGPGFRDHEGIAIFIVYMLCGVLMAINDFLSRTMQSVGWAWTVLTSNGVWAVLMILGSIWLIHPYKGLGVVITQTLAGIGLLIWQWLIVIRI